jgi:NitT/TauT family transport system substrate-binding protein
MKRRDFITSTAALTGAVALGAPLGAPLVARAQSQLPDVINVGHLVGICMSPLFFAHASGYFKDEGLNVQLKFMPNPGDAITALVSNAMDVIHNPFTNAYVGAAQGAPLRIVAGSGAGGLFVIAQKESGIRSMADLAARKGKGVKVGAMRFNTFELTLYRAMQQNNLAYGDFDMVWFNDTLSMASAFEAKAVDVATHVEPFATKMIDQLGGVPLVSNLDVWGPHGPDCVTKTSVRFMQSQPEALRRYIKALLRADAAIKADMAKAVDILDAGKYYRVDKATLTAALPRQKPQVDITQGGENGMEIAVADMVTLGYVKTVPKIIDTSILKQALA